MNKAIAQVKELEVKEAQARAMADIAQRLAAIEAKLDTLMEVKPDGVHQKDEAPRRGR
jgi:hypothetical protein